MKVLILGTRGIPAQHGGFETFAEGLSRFLVERGHSVTVYCQWDEEPPLRRDSWKGVERVNIRAAPSALGTILFDAKAVWDSLWQDGVVLTLGYNTAIFSLVYFFTGRKSVMNMDGLEWKREKWSKLERLWLRFNEFAGAKLSDRLIADHPVIGEHLENLVAKDKITVIPYGADLVKISNVMAPDECIGDLPIHPNLYALVIARPEPENSLLQIVQAFSTATRGINLLVLGRLKPDTNRYHKEVLEAASAEVVFPGAIYDSRRVRGLRQYARLYIHGHKVGGTNPSLVEAMAAGNAVVAHDNPFNRWVAGPGALYFGDSNELSSIFELHMQDAEKIATMRESSLAQHAEGFDQESVFQRYEQLLKTVIA